MVSLVLALTLICYWPALRGALLWDDAGHVTRPDLRSWSGLARIWLDVHATQQYYPVLHSAFWIEHRLWGDATLGYHLVNVLLHAISCCLLALLLRRLWSAPSASATPARRVMDLGPSWSWRADLPVRRGSVGASPSTLGEKEYDFPSGSPASRVVPAGAAWFAAALFAVHPVCVESVAWISEQKNTLSLVFYLLAALLYLEFAAHRRRWAYAGAFLFFVFALGTKSVTATLPAALLVVLWWKHGHLSWRREVVPLLPWFLVAIVAGMFTAWVERNLIGAEGVQFDLSAVQRVLLAGRVIWFYLGKLVWPVRQAFFYDRWDVPAAAAGWVPYVGAALAVTAGLWAIRRRTRGLLAGWLLFVGSLFPALGFFNVYPFVFSYVADHFQYLASLGLIATATGAVAAALAGAPPWMRPAGRVLGGVVVAGFALLANRQSRLYANDETLFRATLAQNPGSWMAHHILGFNLAMSPSGQAGAIAEFREALRLNPDYPDAHTGLAIELARLPGRESEAIAHYERALQLKPGAADAHNNLGIILASLPGRESEALAHFEAALRLNPDFAEAHVNLANALAKLPGRLPEAVPHYEAALRINPASPEMHADFACALARLPGRQSEALAQYAEALRLNPGYAEAQLGLADVLAGLPGRAPEAVAHYEEALRLNPDLVAAHYNLANTLVKLPGRGREAVPHYEAALRLQPDFADAHANLANVLAQVPGRAPEAVAHYEAALRTNPRIAWVQLALALQLSSIPGRETEALFHAGEALRLNPGDAEAHNCLAIIYAQQGRLEAARAQWEQALQLKPNYETARENLRRLEQRAGPSP